jgi:leader peptidase (prepilin peptidase)/N-methyltransferase
VFFVAVAGALGLVIGSFLNVVIYRLPIMLDRDWRAQCRELAEPSPETPPADTPFNLITPRSSCPHCGAPVKPYNNVPVLSYLWLRGRCASCHEPISPQYPLVELFTGVISVIVASRFGYTLECAGALLLCWALIALAVIDTEHQLLPDVMTLPMLWIGIAFAVAGDQGLHFQVLADLRASVIGAMAGYLSLWSFYHLFRILTGKEGMGYGDFKLLAMLGAWLGWQSLPLIILLAAIVGAVTGTAMIVIRGRDRNVPIPFGPYLAGAGFVALMWGHDLVSAYRGVSGL